ncbi:hypothetical protein ACV1CV_14545 [Aeromonas veronii]
MNEVLVLAAVAIFYFYLIQCRRNALKQKAVLANTLKELFNQYCLTEDEKDTVLIIYQMCDRWYLLPIMTIALPFLFLSGKKRSKTPSPNKDAINKFLMACGEVVVKAHPIMSLFMVLWCALWLMITMLWKWVLIVFAFAGTPAFASTADLAQNFAVRTVNVQQHMSQIFRVHHR